MRAVPAILSAALLALSPAVVARSGSSTAEKSAAPLVAVPAAFDGAGAFVLAADGPGRVTAAAEGDGARLVAHGALLVLAGNGARLVSSSAEVELLDGTFRLLAGSSPSRVVIAGRTLEAKRAELVLVRRQDAWALVVLSVGEEGFVALAPAASPEAAVAEDDGAGDVLAPVARPRLIAAGESLVLAPGLAPLRAPRAATNALAAAQEALPLRPAASFAQRLRPIAVEDPADLVFHRGRGGIGDTDIELEAVEIEVGCVEVCVD